MKKRILALVLAVTTACSISACGGGDTDATADNGGDSDVVKVKLGIVGEVSEQWDVIKDDLLAEGIDLEVIKFSDYSIPNQALADGEIDLNSFQHHAFLENEVADKGLDLTVVGETLIAPLGLYSTSLTDIAQIKEGDKIAIPSDATNGGRSLKVLETAGFLTVDPAAGYTPVLSDITENPLNLEFIEVEAAQTPSLLPDVAAAIINGGHAVDNGLTPENDAIYLESGTEGGGNPYVNVLVARADEVDNEVYKKILEAYQSDEVAEVFRDIYKGAYLPAWK